MSNELMNISLINNAFDMIFKPQVSDMNEESINFYIRHCDDDHDSDKENIYAAWIIEEYLDCMDVAKKAEYLAKKHDISPALASRLVITGRKLMGAEVCH